MIKNTKKEEPSAHKMFFEAEQKFLKDLEEDGKRDDQEMVKGILKTLMILEVQIGKGEFYSKNEDLEDLKDRDIKFLMVPFYIARILQEYWKDKDRSKILKNASEKMESFLYWTKQLGMHKGLLSDKTGRNAKVENMRKEMAVKKKVKVLEARRKRFGDDDEDMLSEMERNLYIEKLKLSIIQAKNHKQYIDQELQLLSFKDMHLNDKKIDQIRQDRKNYNAPLKVTRIDKAPDGQLITKNIDYRTNPNKLKNFSVQKIEGPTMTLEQFAMKEVMDAQERSRKEQKANKEQEKEKELLLQDDEDALERKRQKDMKWDAYTDDNVRGAGNMAGKY